MAEEKGLVRVTNLDDMTLGGILAKSGFFKDTKDAAQALVKVLAGRELGIGPIASMTGINIIEGKVAVSSGLLAALIKRSAKYNYRIRKQTSETCEIEFFESGESVGTATFTVEEAKQAGLAMKDNWRRYPSDLCFARALTRGERRYCPDVGCGPVYSAEELGATVTVNEDGEQVMVDVEAEKSPRLNPLFPDTGGQFVPPGETMERDYGRCSCGKPLAPKQRKNGGYFLGCTGYPGCKINQPYRKPTATKEELLVKPQEVTEEPATALEEKIIKEIEEMLVEIKSYSGAPVPTVPSKEELQGMSTAAQEDIRDSLSGQLDALQGGR